MHKLFAVAALCAASFAVPVLPTQAAPLLSDAQTNCLFFPLLKKECWELGAEHAAAVSAKTAAVVSAHPAHDIKLPLVWNCARAPAGSGHLLDC